MIGFVGDDGVVETGVTAGRTSALVDSSGDASFEPGASGAGQSRYDGKCCDLGKVTTKSTFSIRTTAICTGTTGIR